MHSALVVTGTLTADNTVTLDEAPPGAGAKVRLVVEPLAPPPAPARREVMAAIRERQRARGFQPATLEDVEAYLQAERASWGD